MDAKTKATLLKIRTRSTSSLNAKAFLTAFELVGWKCEKLVNLRRKSSYSKDPTAHTGRAIEYGTRTEAELAAQIAELTLINEVKFENNLVIPPAGLKLKVGAVYHTGLDTIRFAKEGASLVNSFDWHADKAVRITAPNGDQIDCYARQMHNAREWAYAHGLEEAVCEFLGLPTVEREKAETEAKKRAAFRHEGDRKECPCCCGDFCLDSKGLLVNHGYERPGDGYNHGNCFAVGYEPYEVSCRACVDYKAHLVPTLENAKTALSVLEAGEVLALTIETGSSWDRKLVTITPTDARWEKALVAEIYHTKQTIKAIEGEITRMDKRIADWKPAT